MTQIDNEELLPCPFCDEPGYIRQCGYNPDLFEASCSECFCKIDSVFTERELAVHIWNSRQQTMRADRTNSQAGKHTEQSVDCREAFERALLETHPNTPLGRTNGLYNENVVEGAWRGWNMRGSTMRDADNQTERPSGYSVRQEGYGQYCGTKGGYFADLSKQYENEASCVHQSEMRYTGRLDLNPDWLAKACAAVREKGEETVEYAAATAIREYLRYPRSPEPVSVSLAKCKWEISKVFVPDGIWNIEEGMKMERAAKAVLDAAGVKYVD